eukprot:1143209-Pelagomonas_calceolata.AAC.4
MLHTLAHSDQQPLPHLRPPTDQEADHQDSKCLSATPSAQERAQARTDELEHLLCSPSSHPNTAEHVRGKTGQEASPKPVKEA